jgi:hypothetical protein
MAEASFNIRAVDSTRQAFASVQNNLDRVATSAQKAGKKIQQSFSIGRGVSVAMVAMGFTMEAIAQKITEKITGVNEEVLKAEEQMLVLMRQRAAADEALAVAKRSDQKQLLALRLEEEQIQDRISRADPQTVDERNQLLEQQIALSQTRLNILNLGAKIEQDQLQVQEAYKNSLQDLAGAQAQIFSGQVSVAERIVGIRGREAQILQDLASIGEEDLETRTTKIKELTMLYDKLAPLLEEQRRLGREAGDMIAMGFEDAILSGNKLSDGLKNLAQDLMRLIFRNVITAPLASSIGNFINGGLGFLAEGGPARAGSPYIVGERGPELFVPGTSGTVIPNDRMNQMGGSAGGTTVNISYNIQSGVSRAELQPILETERKRLRAEIPDMVRRGGSYRSAFA